MKLLKSILFLAIILVIPIINFAQENDQLQKPNVLFIAIDDMNDWTTLFDKDNPIKTPNLNRLAERGVFFTHAYSVVPACTPSRAAVLSGYLPQTSGSYDNPDFFRDVMPAAVTLPQYFRQNGYLAKGAGKIFTHGRGQRGVDPSGKSFDDFQLMPLVRYPDKKYNQTGDDSGRISAPVFDWGIHSNKIIDIDMVEYVERVIEDDWNKPMFLAAGIFRPHLPFYALPENFDKYPVDKIQYVPPLFNDLEDVPAIGKELVKREQFFMDFFVKVGPNHPGSYHRYVQAYMASSDFADQLVGRILDKLDASGKADNTIIVLWSDHGYHLGDKGSVVKYTLWEKANHVPFIIVAPGVGKPGSRVDTPVSLLNIFPTLVELAGLPKKEDLDGKSLVPLMKNPEVEWNIPALSTMGKSNHSIRTTRWRYIEYKDGSQELYDHNYDPWEWTNLANDPNYKSIVEEHKKLLSDYLN